MALHHFIAYRYHNVKGTVRGGYFNNLLYNTAQFCTWKHYIERRFGYCQTIAMSATNICQRYQAQQGFCDCSNS